MAQRLLATLEQAEAVLSRRAAAACTVRWLQRPSLLVAKGGPLCPPPLLHRIRLQKRYLWAWRRQAARPRERGNCFGRWWMHLSLPGGGGRVENLLFKKNVNKKQLFLGPKRAWKFTNRPTPDHTHSPLLPAGNSERFESVIKGLLLTHPLANWGTR